MMSGRSALHGLDAILCTLLTAGAVWSAAPRALQFAVLAALLASMGRAGWAAANALLPDVAVSSRAGCAATVAFGVPTLLALVLGHFGLLQPSLFLAASAASGILLIAAAAGRRKSVGAEPPASALPGVRFSPLRFLERTLLATILLALTLVTARMAHEHRLSPSGWFGFDDNSYHLTAVATWHRFGDLRMPKFSYGDGSTTFYPIGSELFTWTLLAPFGDSDFAARWAQLPFLVGTLVAIWAVARALGVSRQGAALAVALFWSVGDVLGILTLSAGNDLSTAFYAVASLDALLLLGHRPNQGRAAYAGLALGLLVGTKYIALLFCAPLLLVLAASVWAHGGAWRVRFRTSGAATVLLLGTVLAAGGYTYARNTWVAGNPVFPAQIAFGDREILPGWPGVAVRERRTAPESEIDVVRFLTDRRDLFGRAFPFTLLPAAILAPLVALLAPRHRSLAARFEAAAALALPSLLFLLFLYQMHDHRHFRYFLGGIAVAGVACSWLIERVPPSVAVGARCAIACGLLLEVLSRYWRGDTERTLWAGMLLAAAGAGGVIHQKLRSAPRRPQWLAPAAGVITAVAAITAAPALGRTLELYQAEKLDQLPPPHAFEQRAAAALDWLVGPRGAEIAYVGWNRPYLFFGSRLQNGVHIVPTEGEPEERFYDWGGNTDWPYGGDRFWRWRENLETLDVAYVVVILSDRTSPERRWLRRHPRRFSRIYQDEAVEIWRVQAPAPLETHKLRSPREAGAGRE